MSDSTFGATGQIRLGWVSTGFTEFLDGLLAIRDNLGPDAIAEFEALEKQGLKLNDALTGLAAAEAEFASAADSANAATAASTAEWSSYTKALQDANAEYRLFRQQQVMGADVSGDPGNLANMSANTKSTLLDTADANSANIVQALRAEAKAQADQLAAMNSIPLDAHVASYERYNSELETASRQTALYNQYLYDEQVAADKAAAAQLRLAEGNKATEQSLSTTKYAMYDASNALAGIGLGLLALPVASAFMASAVQKDFASVQRVFITDATPTQLAAIKQGLLDLSTQIPVTFKDLTQIATAGAQLGIPAAGIVEFTKVVAEMTKTANVSAQTVETFLQKFYILGKNVDGTHLGTDQFENLASAILNVSIHTGAAEQQISTLATRIVGVAQQAGFTIPQVIGLAAAFSSITAQSSSYELGTITRFIKIMQSAVESGGPALQAFATTAGVTGQQVQAAFGTSQFAGVFQKFIDGLDNVKNHGGDVIGILKDMGITSVRDVPALENLAAAHKTLAVAMQDAAIGWENAGILAQHYNVIQDTLSSKTTELKNTFEAFMNTMGGTSTGPLTQVVGQLEGMLKGLNDFGSTDSGKTFLTMAADALVAAGAFTLLASGFARVVGFGTDIVQAVNGFKNLSAAIRESQTAMALLTGAGQFLTGPWGLALLTITALVATFTVAANNMKASSAQIDHALISNTVSYKQFVDTFTKGNQVDMISAAFGGETSKKVLDDLSGSLKEYKKDVLDAGGDLQGMSDKSATLRVNLINVGDALAKQAQSDLPGAEAGFTKMAASTDGSRAQLNQLLNMMGPYRDELIKQAQAAGQSTSQQNLLRLAMGSTTDQYLQSAGGLKKLMDEQKQAATNQQELNTAFDGGQKAVTTAETAYEKAVAPLYDMKSVLGQMTATLSANAQAQADNYNATLKTGEKQKTAKDFYDGTSASLEVYTKQLNDNADTLTTWNANLIAVTGKYGQQVASQFVQMGATATSESLLNQLTQAAPAQGKAYVDALTKVTDEAGQAQADAFLAAGNILTNDGQLVGSDTAAAIGKAMIAGEPIDDIIKQYHLKWANQPDYSLAVSTADAQAKLNAFIAANTGRTIQLSTVASGGQPVLTTGAPGGKMYAEGGYTGDGTKFQPAGVVHAGEFVFSQAATRNIGIANLAYAHEMAKTGKGYAEGGYVGTAAAIGGGGGIVQVALSAYDRALLERAGNLQVVIPGQAIMQATNAGNVSANTRRSN